jgi:hypothetical protein
MSVMAEEKSFEAPEIEMAGCIINENLVIDPELNIILFPE